MVMFFGMVISFYCMYHVSDSGSGFHFVHNTVYANIVLVFSHVDNNRCTRTMLIPNLPLVIQAGG